MAGRSYIHLHTGPQRPVCNGVPAAAKSRLLCFQPLCPASVSCHVVLSCAVLGGSAEDNVGRTNRRTISRDCRDVNIRGWSVGRRVVRHQFSRLLLNMNLNFLNRPHAHETLNIRTADLKGILVTFCDNCLSRCLHTTSQKSKHLLKLMHLLYFA